jgi:hypothetical protein
VGAQQGLEERHRPGARDAETPLKCRGGRREVALPQMREAEGEEAMGETEGLIAALADRDSLLRACRRLAKLAYLGEGSGEEAI